MPEISVVVPIYNVCSYLQKCVESVLAQSFDNFELLLIDDGSTDGSGELADTLAVDDARVKVFHKTNGGLSDARNYGVKHAAGKYVTFIDSDDWIEGSYLEYLYSLLVENDADISTCYFNKCIGDKRYPWQCPNDEVLVMDSKEALLSLLYHERINVSAPGKLYRVELTRSGIEYPVGKHYEDVDTTWRFIAEATKLAVGQQPLYNYVMRQGSIVHQVSDGIFDRSDLALDAYEGLVALGDADISMAAERYLVFNYLSVLRSIDLNSPDHLARAKKLSDTVKEHSLSVLSDSRTPRRDRVALYALRFGLHFYRFAWNAYCKLREDR